MSEPVALLSKEIGALVQRLRVWTPNRWAVPVEQWGTRADVARHLAQWMADQAAELESSEAHTLPVLQPDLLVADQLAVTGDDLVRAQPPDSVAADAVAHLLAHRFDLLAEEPPASLGGAAALRRGREVCAS